MSTYTDAQMLWPVSNGESLNCSGILGNPVIPNGNSSRVCGVKTNRAIAQHCCGSAEVKDYQCWLYCDSTKSILEWAKCANDNTTAGSWDPFCQGKLTPNNTETLTSSALHSSTPKYSWMIVVLVCTFLFLGPAQATIIPSLDNGLVKRQSGSGCSLMIDKNYTSLQHGSKRVAGPLTCINNRDQYCSFEASIETPLNENNRTLNGSSAAEPNFDAFFDVVSDATGGRKFPALSSVNVTQSVTAKGAEKVGLGWTPISVCRWTLHLPSNTLTLVLQFCVNGTVSGCGDTLAAATDGSYFEACGPTYVDNADDNSAIQGVFNTIVRPTPESSVRV